MLKWSVTTLSREWEPMDVHLRDVAQNTHTPLLGVLLCSHTLFGSVNLHLQLLLLQ